MAKGTKNGLAVLIALSVMTFGIHMAYRAEAQSRGRSEAPERAESPPWRQAAAPAQPRAVSATVAVNTGGDAVKLSTVTDRTAVLRDGDGTVHVEVSIETDGVVATGHVPSDMVVIVDRSGSMGGQKIEYARQALRGLIARLQPEDRFALVEYDNTADVRVPLAHVTYGARESFLRSVDQLGVGGGTNMSAGLDLGLDQVISQREPNRPARVLLLSDGLANEGDFSLSGLTRRARRAVSGEFVLSTMGIGNDFDENVMTSIARAGTGAFYYLAKLEALQAFLNAELQTAGETYAQGAELRFQPAPGVRVTSASGAVLEREGELVRIPVGSLYSGQKQKVWLTLHVPVNDLRDHELGQLGLDYRRNGRAFEIPGPALPRVATTVDPSVFRARIVRPVWERATLEVDLSAVQERLGVAIGSGKASDVDDALSAVPDQRRLARELGSQTVLDGLSDLEKRGVQAKQAQAAPAAERSAAAKRQSAEAFSSARPSAYKNIRSDVGY